MDNIKQTVGNKMPAKIFLFDESGQALEINCRLKKFKFFLRVCSHVALLKFSKFRFNFQFTASKSALN